MEQTVSLVSKVPAGLIVFEPTPPAHPREKGAGGGSRRPIAPRLAILMRITIAIVGLSLASDNPDCEGLSMQNERTIDDGPSLRAVTAKIEELLAANPKATDKARFKMLSKWLEHNPEHQKSINAFFLTATHRLSIVPPELPETDVMLKREGGL
jgi:hypothetical protein